MSRFQFHLRTLLLTTLALGCGLGWWFRPFSIEQYWSNGQMKLKRNVRRQWNGEIVTHGEQSWWWKNGQLARQGMSFGKPINVRLSFHGFGLSQEVTFNEVGEPMDPTRDNFALMWVGAHTDGGFTRSALPAAQDDRFAETPHE